MASPVTVCAINFWSGFSLESGFVKYLLEQAVGPFTIVSNEKDADIVLTSVFGRRRRRRWYRRYAQDWPAYPDRTIAVIWENERPNYQHYRFSLSSDFDSYGDRNCRVPLWFAQLHWPGYTNPLPAPGQPFAHGYEPLVDIDMLMRPRPDANAAGRESFCCLVAANPEPHRMWSVERLSTVAPVDLFGAIAKKPMHMSKYELLSRYRFNLCFENSVFPGYYTEKLLHAWASGCIPLYYSDRWFSEDFNPKAAINRIDFPALDDFVRHVAAVNASADAMTEIAAQPLLTRRPTLDHAIAFLRRACEDIMAAARR
jgi:hypothetical protein